MKFVPNEATRFAAGKGGVFYSLDGATWRTLFTTDQLPGIPWALSLDTRTSSSRSLYVSFNGRGLLRFDNIPVPGVVQTR